MSRIKKNKDGSIQLVDFDSTKDPLAEAFRMLRLQIEASIDADGQMKSSTILITSVVQGEGKTTIASNLAEVCAIAHIPTLLLDADLRKPMVHQVFDIPRTPGVTDILMDDNPASIPVIPTLVSDLSLIPAGRPMKHTTEILGSPAFIRFMEKLKSQFKLIIIDSPPVGIVADAGVLARKVDGIYLVVRAGHTNSRAVEKTVKNLKDLGGNVRGIILSRVNARRDRYYYYHYYPHYYSKYYADDDQRRFRRRRKPRLSVSGEEASETKPST